jgi:pimeloyl-ACP methyl ester carboxylesterase
MDVALEQGMFVRSAGRASGRTLLFIHCLADCGLAFTPLFETPLADAFRLIAADLPGFGASPRRDGVATIAEHADAVTALVQRLAPIGPVGLVAHSVGSMIAVEAAQHLGERFGGLFSIEGNLTAEDAYFSGRAAAFDDPYAFKQRFLDDLWHMPEAAHHAPVPCDGDLGGRRRPVESRARCQAGQRRRCAGPGLPAHRPSLYYWSADSTVPGTRDWIIANGLPQSQFSDATHWPMIDRPAETAQAMQRFFGGI